MPEFVLLPEHLVFRDRWRTIPLTREEEQIRQIQEAIEDGACSLDEVFNSPKLSKELREQYRISLLRLAATGGRIKKNGGLFDAVMVETVSQIESNPSS